jgi:hypothetical protein
VVRADPSVVAAPGVPPRSGPDFTLVRRFGHASVRIGGDPAQECCHDPSSLNSKGLCMQKVARFAALLLSTTVLWGCSSTVTVPVPPRVDLQGFGTLGLVDFSSNANASINAQTTREFESHIHAAQPGTRIVELGGRDALLAAVGSRTLDAQALRKIGQKYGVEAIFVGTLNYSEPKTEVKVTDVARLEGGVRVELRGDINIKLMETRSGANMWSSSAWARRQIGRMNVSAEQGVNGTLRGSTNPREEMVPALVYHLTEDFRPGTVRQKVQ